MECHISPANDILYLCKPAQAAEVGFLKRLSITRCSCRSHLMLVCLITKLLNLNIGSEFSQKMVIVGNNKACKQLLIIHNG